MSADSLLEAVTPYSINFDIGWLILYNQLKLELLISPTFLPCLKLFLTT